MDFGSGLSEEDGDTVRVQVADYAPAVFTEQSAQSLTFGEEGFTVTFDALPALDDEVQETVVATVTESRTGFADFAFTLEETAAASNYFIVRGPDLSIDYDPSAPGTMTVHYVSGEMSTVVHAELAEFDGIYVDDPSEPILTAVIDYYSGDDPDRKDALVVTFSFGTSPYRLVETGTATHTYSAKPASERTTSPPREPHVSLFEVVGSFDKSDASVPATIDAGAGPVSITLAGKTEKRSGLLPRGRATDPPGPRAARVQPRRESLQTSPDQIPRGSPQLRLPAFS